jgi:D-serine deaminase-like pyridoxal phosphate-dependent protein
VTASGPLPSLPTPTLLVDADVLDLNLRDMARLATSRGLALRPHAKTHKSPDLARLQIDSGAVGLTVATLAEAERFAGAGFDDLFIAYPLWVDTAKSDRLRRLLDRCSLRIGVDSVQGAQALAAQLGDDVRRVAVLLEVDSGHHRSGVAPEAAGELSEVVAHTGLDVVGVFTFPGHSYAPQAAGEVAAQEARALAAAATGLADHGIAAPVVSGGSTPTAAQTGEGLSELRPGVYVFGDAQQWELGTVPPDRVALTCLATVVSHAGGRVVLDTGSKALGADRLPWASGFGRLLDHPGARIVLLGEHHAVVEWDGPPPPLGSRIRVVPNHVCNAVNLHDELVVVRGGEVVDRWPITARGANT